MPQRRTPPHRQGVMLLPGESPLSEHVQAVHQALGVRLATLLGTRLLDEDDLAGHPTDHLYYLPADTLVGESCRRSLHLTGPQDLFGGWVALPWMGTKAISHPIPPGALHPAGWSVGFARDARPALLDGWTVFSLADAIETGRHWLQQAPLRLKPVRACAGRGQSLIHSENELDAILSQLDEEEVTTWGLVLEGNLSPVRTYSVGQTEVAGLLLSYVGEQRLTRDHQGVEVYGGSDLILVRGDYEALLALPLDDEQRAAIQSARRYDAAAFAHLPGLIASRRNYDVAVGRNAQGQNCCGVLEQSWRLGGASAAEVLALEAFAADPRLMRVRASTHEIFGDPDLPDDAVLLYRGNDPDVGRLCKFARLRRYGDS